jgi:methylmalonyl-CoA/ethylmalonyl-CoA epimerase
MIQAAPDWRFHHIGVACEDLDSEAASFEQLGYRREGPPFSDPRQGIKGLFLVGAGPRMELVAPVDSFSTVLKNILGQRHKMYHLAYAVVDVPAALNLAKSRRGKVVVLPSAAVAFGGYDICFIAFPNRLLVELIDVRGVPSE